MWLYVRDLHFQHFHFSFGLSFRNNYHGNFPPLQGLAFSPDHFPSPSPHLPFGFNKIFHNSLDAFAIDTCWWHLFLCPSLSVAPSLSLSAPCCVVERVGESSLRLVGKRCTTVSSVVRCRCCPQDLSLASSTMPGADDGPVGLGPL